MLMRHNTITSCFYLQRHTPYFVKSKHNSKYLGIVLEIRKSCALGFASLMPIVTKLMSTMNERGELLEKNEKAVFYVRKLYKQI